MDDTMTLTTPERAWKRVQGRDLIELEQTTGRVFRVPHTRSYKGQQPSLTILNIDPNVSAIYANAEVLIEGEAQSANFPIRFTYEYEMLINEDEENI